MRCFDFSAATMSSISFSPRGAGFVFHHRLGLLALDLAARLDDLATLVRFEAIAKERDAWLEGAEGTAVELVGETDVGVGFFVTKLAKT